MLKHYQVIVLWGFAGAIVGTIPSLIKESTKQSQRDKVDWLWLVLTFVISGLGLYFLNDLIGTLPANFLTFILAGALIALGVLVPGLSPSNLLLILGLYGPMLIGFKSLDLLGTFLPIAIGGVLAILAFSKSMDYALQHHHSKVYHFIIGIVLSSTLLILIPNSSSPESISYSHAGILTWLMAVVLFALGIWLGLWMSQLEENTNNLYRLLTKVDANKLVLYLPLDFSISKGFFFAIDSSFRISVKHLVNWAVIPHMVSSRFS